MSVTLSPAWWAAHQPGHKKIVRVVKIRGLRTGHNLHLECGHTVIAFGRELPGQENKAAVFCDECDQAATTGMHGFARAAGAP
jgi:hypothetical protein